MEENKGTVPSIDGCHGHPGRNPGKSHWSVDDCFHSDPQMSRVFTHLEYQIGLHTHEFVEINLVMKGSGRHYMEENELETRRGDVFVIPAKVEHGYVNDENLNVFHMLLHPLFIQRQARHLSALSGYLMLFTVEPYFRRRNGFRHGMRLVGESLEIAETLARLLDDEKMPGESERDWAIESLTAYFVIHLCRCYAEQNRMSSQDAEFDSRHPHWRAVRLAMELVARRGAMNLTLEELAKAACMQKNYFCRVFRAAIGMTPMEYVQRERIREARRLLSDGSLSVSEVGGRLGFFDTAHFSRTFTRIVGISPVKFRSHKIA